MKRAGKCVHYNGTVNECCAAGVNYKALAGPGEAWGLRLPCWGKDGVPGTKVWSGGVEQVIVDCTLRKLPTPEELAAEEKAHEERMAKMILARSAIVEACGGLWNRKTNATGRSGVIDCPACGGTGTLAYTRAAYNGHIHAACKTEGCVRWME